MVKRCADAVLSGLGLIILAPLMVVVAVLIWLRLGRPIFFTQPRIGYRGAIFQLLKFRTMHAYRDSTGKLASDEDRLDSFGRFLRATSLDELPQLWNVLMGTMSLVGPRPLLVEYLPRYSAEQARRHDVLPGLTGWVQVNGRNALSWEQKFEMDIWYVDHHCFLIDVKILILTVWRVLRLDGISHAGCATMPHFLGSSHKDEAK